MGVLAIHLLAFQHLLVSFCFYHLIRHGHGEDKDWECDKPLPSFILHPTIFDTVPYHLSCRARLSIRFILDLTVGYYSHLTLGLLLFSRQSMNLLEMVILMILVITTSSVLFSLDTYGDKPGVERSWE